LSLKGGTIDGNLVVTDTTDTKTLIVNKIKPGISEDKKFNADGSEEVKTNASIRVEANLVINNGEVVIGDDGQVHAQGQFTTHADRFLFVEPEDPDQLENVYHYSLSVPSEGIKDSNPIAYLPYEGGHLVTEENVVRQSSY
jgi:hypothetical protein